MIFNINSTRGHTGSLLVIIIPAHGIASPGVFALCAVVVVVVVVFVVVFGCPVSPALSSQHHAWLPSCAWRLLGPSLLSLSLQSSWFTAAVFVVDKIPLYHVQ